MTMTMAVVVVDGRRRGDCSGTQTSRAGSGTSGAGAVTYAPGDVIDIYPQNHLEDTLAALKQLGLHPDDVVEIKLNPDAPGFLRKNAEPLLPPRLTVLELFRVYLDVFGTPGRYFFEVLSHFATDPMQKEKLKEFNSPEGQLELYRYATREKRTYIEVLADFRSAQLPLSHFISHVPRMQPRQFSIASSCLKYPNQAHICMAVVEYKTPFRREKRGICSSWLASLLADSGGHQVPVSFSKGSFRMPSSLSTPVLMVGPGTGIAPFMSMCQEREVLLTRLASKNGIESTKDYGGAYVFFGNRFRDKDYLYREEWKLLTDGRTENGTKLAAVTGFYCAFSRDQKEKVYVQHRLAEQKDIVWDVLGKRNGTFMLAGNSQKMPNDVRKQVQEIVRAIGKMSEREAKMFLLRMDAKRQYVQETWS